MNDQEREVIADIFRRLEQVADEPRDPEAERFIGDKLRQQPYASYAMAQAIFIQEQALANLHSEVEALRAEVEEARRQPQRSGGILASLFGGGARSDAEAYRQNASPIGRRSSPWGSGLPDQPARMGGPWGGAVGQPGNGGFLQGALSTAAGVAGGMMMANALTSAFSGKHQGAEAGGEKAALADTGSAHDTDNASITDSLYGDPGQNSSDFDDFGGGGDGGDWA